jgi:hypothetical protein
MIAGTGRDESTIHLEDLAESARSVEAVRIQGRYRGGADTFLQVERWRETSGWPSRCPRRPTSRAYSHRVLDPNSGVKSKLCAINQGLTSSGHLPPDSRTASNLAKTMTLSRYLRLAAS